MNNISEFLEFLSDFIDFAKSREQGKKAPMTRSHCRNVLEIADAAVIQRPEPLGLCELCEHLAIARISSYEYAGEDEPPFQIKMKVCREHWQDSKEKSGVFEPEYSGE